MLRWLPAIGLGLILAGADPWIRDAAAQATAPTVQTLIPDGATTLEGTPSVRIDTTAERTSRRVLSRAEQADDRLTIRLRDGKLYWASRDDRPLSVHRDGEFTYLSADPGHYIKVRKLNDRLEYVEHVAQGPGIVTFWGELRVLLGR